MILPPDVGPDAHKRQGQRRSPRAAGPTDREREQGSKALP